MVPAVCRHETAGSRNGLALRSCQLGDGQRCRKHLLSGPVGCHPPGCAGRDLRCWVETVPVVLARWVRCTARARLSHDLATVVRHWGLVLHTDRSMESHHILDEHGDLDCGHRSSVRHRLARVLRRKHA